MIPFSGHFDVDESSPLNGDTTVLHVRLLYFVEVTLVPHKNVQTTGLLYQELKIMSNVWENDAEWGIAISRRRPTVGNGFDHVWVK